ncbi:Gag-Pol polyprotein [Frankliniella fusca]|uniref:Gag-Pol polyprotein n=1 Tax=Frankliniella fusca TaxID=407009 RepID=A0AAE1LL63_9NEOP|nr:Gag-Pol polyprotein [Frankliniella fusca]
MVWHMPGKTDAPNVIAKLDEVINLFGPPEMLVCDNGPPFIHNVPKYHPESNGQAERMVQTAKRKFKAFLLSEQAENLVQIRQKINLFFEITIICNAYAIRPMPFVQLLRATRELLVKTKTAETGEMLRLLTEFMSLVAA